MVLPIQTKKLKKKLHIALFFVLLTLSGLAKAQTVILSGDVTIVAVGSSEQDVKIVSFIPIEKGTELYLKAFYDNEETSLEFKIIAQESISLGQIFSLSDDILVSSDLDYKSSEKAKLKGVLLSQREGEIERYVYGIKWGENAYRFKIPEVLSKKNGTFIELGKGDYHHYNIRNGLSGTPKMLKSWIGDVSKWVSGSETFGLNYIGSFNVMKPPVVMFNQSVSTVFEEDEIAQIDVSIYEHDGSRLEIEIAFDSVSSSISREDLGNFHSKKINFSGLIGDAVYQIEIPLSDDDYYSGLKTANFEIRNLNELRAGDFQTHSLIIQEKELPNLSMRIHQEGDLMIEIINLEERFVSLKNWKIRREKVEVYFEGEVEMGASENIFLADSNRNPSTNGIFSVEALSELFSKSGKVELLDANEKVISTVNFRLQNKKNTASNQQTRNLTSSINSQISNGMLILNPVSSVTSGNVIAKAGYEVLESTDLIKYFENLDFVAWSEEEGLFASIEKENLTKDLNRPVIGYFSDELADSLSKLTHDYISKIKQEQNASFAFNLSASDKNGNNLVDQMEGLNLLKNGSGSEISSQWLISQIQDKLNLSTEIQIFIVDENWEMVQLSKNYRIPENAVFWIKLNQVLKEKQVEVNTSNQVEEMVETEVVKPAIHFTLNPKNADLREKSFRLFVTDERTVISQHRLDFSSFVHTNPTFHADSNRFSFYSDISNRRFSSFETSLDGEQSFSIPLIIDTNVEDEFNLEVSSLESFVGYKIRLIDLEEEKSHNLVSGFSLSFSPRVRSLGRGNEHKTPRFMLEIVPDSNYKDEFGDETDTPRVIELFQNYPNPFNPTTSLSFYIPETNKVRVSVFNVVGQPVAVLFDGTLSAGEHILDWDATENPSGMYIYQLEVGTKVLTRKMTLVK